MKSTLNTFTISLISAFFAIVAFNYFSNNEKKLIENKEKLPTLLPTTYSFNASKVPAEMTDFTIAACRKGTI